ncbi:hypothetical protein PC39_11037 [Salinisphaera sp. PC39]|uniref:HvfC family RiPP maturation protein n=1 Tax=Salinisphaera sp. PC39 TaxID=1304156 RepID=UPI0033417C72
MSEGGGRPRFQQLQYEFAAHLRDPERHPPPAGVEDRRLAVYRDLFFNNVGNYLAKAFPVLRRIYADDDWDAMVRDFFARHESHGPQFYQVAGEFLAYLDDERGERPEDPPFLRELAHYEWVELRLAILDADPDAVAADPDGDLLAQAPVLSPTAWPLVYRYPVHTLGPDNHPDTPPDEPTHLVVFRDRGDRVRFLKINPVTARLLALIRERPEAPGREHLETIAAELRHPDPATVIAGGRDILADLTARDVILGTRPPDAPA